MKLIKPTQKGHPEDWLELSESVNLAWKKVANADQASTGAECDLGWNDKTRKPLLQEPSSKKLRLRSIKIYIQYECYNITPDSIETGLYCREFLFNSKPDKNNL